ncbi:MAG TPA: hypothetical protein VJ735_20145 [Actinomycetes bacterium]|nr:hypothetical protein [Actinomycetes bacterium]
MWRLSLISAPAALPLDRVGEVYPHCRLEPEAVNADQNHFLDTAIDSARRLCEAFTNRQLVTATWELVLDSFFEEGIFREGALWLPRPPHQSITSIKYLDGSGVEQTWASTDWGHDVPAAPISETQQKARVWPAYGKTWPQTRCQPAAVKVRFVNGYGATFDSVPPPLRKGMLLVVGELHESRELQVTGTIVAPNILGAERLWWPFRT